MSQSPVAVSSARRSEDDSDVDVVESERAVQRLLDALDDADCRAILEETSDEALSAKELADACDLPLSTAYRKLDLLTDADLLEERTRIRRTGKHASEYSRLVEDVVLSLGPDGGVELSVSRREQSSSFDSVPAPNGRR